MRWEPETPAHPRCHWAGHRLRAAIRWDCTPCSEVTLRAKALTSPHCGAPFFPLDFLGDTETFFLQDLASKMVGNSYPVTAKHHRPLVPTQEGTETVILSSPLLSACPPLLLCPCQ